MTTLAITREYTSVTYGLPLLIFIVRKEDSYFQCKCLILQIHSRRRPPALEKRSPRRTLRSWLAHDFGAACPLACGLSVDLHQRTGASAAVTRIYCSPSWS
jgi:hypothetical protein